ncbi:CheA signal transduction histidine kinases [Shewanella sp. MR-4]|uniref:chemotaxis protein CheA n=1 Tax=Shewanella sp. (strain MR-4) TaxID=60480 RepID=UPI00005E5852|nr:chemotaxis protein CheA [Shewanella sp. MR-4]ABI39166.1 CheA signal transduction histidine kinases [Shewanella sp. MR-4]
MSINMAEFHQVFFEESHEHLENMEQLLLALDLDAPDPEELNTIFRAAHSIKGGSGIFGFTALTSVTHVMENLLDKTRKGTFELSSSVIDLLLRTVDTLSHILNLYREEEPIDWQQVEFAKNQLVAVLNGETFSTQTANAANGVSAANPNTNNQTEDKPLQAAVTSSVATQSVDDSFGFFEDEVELGLVDETEHFGFFDEAYTAKEIRAEDINAKPSAVLKTSTNEHIAVNKAAPVNEDSAVNGYGLDDELGYGFFESLTPETFASEIDALTSASAKANPMKDAISPLDVQTESSISKPTRAKKQSKEAKPLQANTSTNAETTQLLSSSAAISAAPASSNQPAAKKASAASQDATLRVETSKIDTLVNLAGELVITQSMLTLIGNELGGELGERLKTALNELERNTREMQEAVMSVRMLPVSFVFNRFHRLVRDLSDQLGKNVSLVIEGGNTEIDKGMIEKLVDPLTHLVRNSLDHGIEKPEKRLAAGKTEAGVLSLKASQRGGSIVIAVHDDGGGLNRERILQKARENGMALPENMTDKQVWQLIFAAGFSTAAEVTDVSGRGVGMDVVRKNIEALGGRIDIDSVAGQGATFEIQLPLTLAIVDGMSVSVGNQIYILPLVHIIESIQPQTEQLKFLAKERLLRVREEYLPLLNLYQLMEIEPQAKTPEAGIVVLLESNNKRFGLCVDALVGQQQVVIKSLEKHYRRIPGVSGATIMGDGSVALILDVESLALHIKN